MRSNRRRMGCLVLPMALLGMLASPPRRADAGPGTYDPATRSFRLTYTYAVVPSAGMMGDQLEQLGQARPATPDQDAKIRAFFAAVSDKLWDATDQRGKIGSFTCVDNVKQADVIVSPSGKIGRGGFATPGGFEDRQGHLVVSYEDLTASGKDIDAQLTIFHELSHYLFALPDEYRDGEQVGLCPQQNPSGPGCLMDNYWFDGPRHGWYGRFCDADHNAQAPLPQTIITGQTAQQACKQLIDLFFQSHLKGADAANPPAGAGTGAATPGGGGAAGAGTNPSEGTQPTPDAPFAGIFASLVEATGGFLRDLIQDAKDAGKTAPSAAGLRTQATKFLRNQVAFGRQNSRMADPTADQIRRGVETAVQSALTSRLSAPQRFGATVVEQILQKAKEIAATELGKPGGSSLIRSPLTTSASARDRATATLQRRIETQLVSFARDALGLTDRNLAADQRAFSPEEKAYLRQVSADAAATAMADDNTPLGQYLAAAKIHIRISQLIARMALDTRDELDVPGTDILRNVLTDYERQLYKYALPGAPYRNFGLRRTVIFAPMPVSSNDDHLPLQASPSYTYRLVRQIALGAIRSLIVREKILTLPEDMTPAVELEDPNRTDAERVDLVRRQITFLTDQVRRNRFDNIIVLVPAGGLPEDLGDELESLRKRMAASPDVRLDLVSIDASRVPQRLIDLCARSRGSWLFASDVDAFGAVAQRLRGEGLAGSWVIIPKQGRVDFTPTRGQQDPVADNAPPDAGLAPRAVPLRFRRNRLFLYNHLPGWGDPAANVRANPDQAEIQGAIAGGLRGPDVDRNRLIEVLVQYIRDIASEKDDKTPKDVADVYAELYNANFFTEGQGQPVTFEKIRDAARQRGLAQTAMPSLATLRDDLRSFGGNLNNVVAQNDFNKTISPWIDHLDRLRSHLDDLDAALGALKPDDPRSLKAALDRTIQARRDLAGIPRPDSEGFYDTEDYLYGSAAMRRAIERSILVRLNRFTASEKDHLEQANKVAEDPRQLEQLVGEEKEYRAYAELVASFSQLFRNLHGFDLKQAAEAPNAKDDFAEFARKLNEASGRRQPAIVGAVVQDLAASSPTPLVFTRSPGETYLQLLAEVYLDLFDLQNELSRGGRAMPSYDRFPRDRASIVRLPAQAGGQGNPDKASLAAQLLAEDPQAAQVVPLDLKPFTAEEKASFDLIVGFTRKMDFVDHLQDDPPVLRLFDKAGADANEKGAPFLQLDPARTTDRMLVFRLPYPSRDAGRIASGNYYPRLYLKPKHLPDRGGQADYTFSVASENPKVVLSATLRQVAIRADTDEENDDEVANRGIIARSKSAAIIEAMVTAGSPVQGVDVTGFYQQVELQGGPISSKSLTFLDDGLWPDTTKGDGVYTAKITLDPQEKRKQAQYRVLIEARSNDKTSYVPTETFKKPDPPADSGTSSRTTRPKPPQAPVDDAKLPPVPRFQRATSVNFLVEGEAAS